MRRRFIALSLSVAGLVTVAACSSTAGDAGDAPAGDQSSGAASGSPSPPGGSPSAATGVDIPGRATENSMDGVKAFTSFWVSTLNEATDTGDTSTLRRLAAKSCTMCTDFADHLDEIYGAGGRVESEGWEVESQIPIAGQPEENPGIQLNVKIHPQKVYESQNAKPKPYTGGEQRFRMFLVREGDHWLVQRMTV